MRNSKYPTFDPEYAQDLEKNWPQIWKRGGNIEGNNQYRRLLPIVTRKDKKAKTDTERMAIKKREAWAARHLGDFRIAGTVAQIKWFVIGEKGESYMKKLLNDEKKRISEKKMYDRRWYRWQEEAHGPSERRLQKAISAYLSEARKRYIRRARAALRAQKGGAPRTTKAIISWSELLSLGEEINKFIVAVGRDWLAVWSMMGDRELGNVFKIARKKRPMDLMFGTRDIAKSSIDLTAFEVASTTAKDIQGIIEQGLISGASTTQIANAIDNSKAFGMSRSKMIARTEATKAINLATDQAYQTAANEGIRIRKRWLTSRDDKVRETHQELEGQIVGVSEDFVVPSTGEQAPAPAAFSSPAESINCRCTIVPVID